MWSIWAMLWACQVPVEEAVPETIATAGPDRSIVVGDFLELDAIGSVGTDFLWDFGDGSQQAGAQVRHRWEVPGRYSVVLQVTGEDGARRTDTALVVVHRPIPESAPQVSRTVAVSQDAVWVVNPDQGTVSQLVDGLLVSETWVCERPRAVSAGTQGVAVLCEDRLMVRSSEEWTEHSVYGAGAHGEAMVWDGQEYQVLLRGFEQVVSSSEGRIQSTGPDPRGLSLAPDGTLWVSRFRSPPTHGVVTPMGREPWSLALDPGPDSDTGNRGVPNLLEEVVVSPDGATVFLPVTLSNIQRGVFRDGLALTHETTIRGALIALNATTGEERWRHRFDDQGRAAHVAVSPLGDRVFVAFPGTMTVLELDAYTGDIRGSLLNAGQGLRSLVVSDDGTTLIGHGWLDRTVTAWDVSSSPFVPRWSTTVVTTDVLTETVLRGKQLFHDALDLRLAKDGYLSCSGCHPDGDQDGQTWDFSDRGEGLRNTTSLLGRAGLAMGPLHWSGNFDEVQDFEHDLRESFGGSGLLSESDWESTNDPLGTPKAGRSPDLDALAAYVSSLTETPRSPHSEPDASLILSSEGCTTCHVPPLYTDSALGVRHDVGTLWAGSGQRLGGELDGLDTPTLLGAWDSGPYLHDGSASTVEDAIDAHVPGLTGEQLTQLANAVRSL